MTYLRLLPQLSFGLVAGRPIFLDVRRDRYLALDPLAEASFIRLCAPGSPPIAEGPDFARLVATGLFARSDEWKPLSPAAIQIPDRQLPPARASWRALLDVPEIWLLLRQSRRDLASGALETCLAALKAHRREAGRAITPAATAALATRFQKARALVPITPSCLQDSLALGRWLARRGACPAIVIGVKLDPFAAHCWVQTPDLIINDAPDIVSPFTPVLVIR